MVYDWKMEAYWRLPVFVQNLALSVYGWRLDRLYYGGEYPSALEAVGLRQWGSAEEIEIWQMAEFRRILASAVAHVPHYRQLAPLEVESFRTIPDLARLAVLERQELHQRESRFLDERLDAGKLFKDKTSGSTGTSLTIFWPPACLRQLQAVLEVRVRYAAGVAREMPRAMLGGRPIVRGSTRRPPYWRHNRYWRQIYLSSYHVSRAAAPGYIRAIRRSGVQWLTGYGSAIAALAESATAENVPPMQMRAVIVSGDTLQPGMRKSIESFFGGKCFDMYGLVEAAALAMECAAGRMHVIPDAGIVEILDAAGRPCPPGEVGEIVATGLLNDGMPLIRYRTGDTAALARDQACVCGSRHPILESLEGRVDDYLVTADGRQVGRLSTAMKRSPTIHSAQLVQDRPGHAYLLVRPGEGYRASDVRTVEADIIERIGAFDVEVREVSEIPSTPTGKTRLVVRLSPSSELWRVYDPLLRAAGGAPGPEAH